MGNERERGSTYSVRKQTKKENRVTKTGRQFKESREQFCGFLNLFHCCSSERQTDRQTDRHRQRLSIIYHIRQAVMSSLPAHTDQKRMEPSPVMQLPLAITPLRTLSKGT